jgi:hypothetical protein
MPKTCAHADEINRDIPLFPIPLCVIPKTCAHADEINRDIPLFPIPLCVISEICARYSGLPDDCIVELVGSSP